MRQSVRGLKNGIAGIFELDGDEAPDIVFVVSDEDRAFSTMVQEAIDMIHESVFIDRFGEVIQGTKTLLPFSPSGIMETTITGIDWVDGSALNHSSNV